VSVHSPGPALSASLIVLFTSAYVFGISLTVSILRSSSFDDGRRGFFSSSGPCNPITLYPRGRRSLSHTCTVQHICTMHCYTIHTVLLLVTNEVSTV
jgi:hypothetical protein